MEEVRGGGTGGVPAGARRLHEEAEHAGRGTGSVIRVAAVTRMAPVTRVACARPGRTLDGPRRAHERTGRPCHRIGGDPVGRVRSARRAARAAGHRRSPPRPQPRPDGPRQLLLQVADRGREAEGVPGAGQGAGAPGPRLARVRRGAVRPEELRGRPRGRLVDERPGPLVQGQQRPEDDGRVVVVHAPLVALVVRLPRGLADQGGQVVGAGQAARSVLPQQAGGEVLGAVDGGRLGGEGAVPVGAAGREGRVGDR
ncbi:hypothetical protein STENM223S_00194 [Streptomyces tendae]